MKKIYLLFLGMIMILSLSACSKKDGSNYKVAMITDYGEITDQSFNQTVYTACKDYCDSQSIEFVYYKPAGDSDENRIDMIQQAAEDGYNIIVLPGFSFINPILKTASMYKEIKFVAIDISKSDILDVILAGNYSGNPDEYDLNELADLSNVYFASFQEEISGFLAGYAAVSMGYTSVGFIGGMDIPSVKRYGYGFLQGLEVAGAERGIESTAKYIYSGTFSADPKITNKADEWYKDGCEVIFVAGGGIYTSVAEAAKINNGKIIGVDVNQAGIINKLAGEGTTITSAMKGLHACAFNTLEDIINNDNWQKYAGKTAILGIVSGSDPKVNYCQLPLTDTLFNDSFSQSDYINMVSLIHSKEIRITSDTDSFPKVSYVTILDEGFIN